MTKPIIQETNATTGETIEREMTAAEIQARNAVIAEMAQTIADAESKAVEKTALLQRLGLTEAEAKLLIS